MSLRTWILLAGLALFALPAFAQRYFYADEPIGAADGSDWSGGGGYSNGVYLDNPCTAVYDWVWVNYEVYLQQEGWDLSGEQRIMTDEQTTLGGAYAASGESRSDVVYMLQPFTLRKYHKVNTYDAFHVVTVIDFHPATRQSTVSLEAACGNGMPDSLQ